MVSALASVIGAEWYAFSSRPSIPMDTRLIAFAIPFFFLLIGIESAISRKQGIRRYRLHDSINSLSCGIGEQVVVVFTLALSLGTYVWASEHLALTHIPTSSVPAWIAVFILVDHSFYWFHRFAHRVNFMWAGHAVHHQSEEYNLSTALRQSWIENLLAWPFYLPLALVGFPLEMFATASTVNTLYQFWVHTRIMVVSGRSRGSSTHPRHTASTTPSTRSTSTGTTAECSWCGTASTGPTSPRKKSRSTAR